MGVRTNLIANIALVLILILTIVTDEGACSSISLESSPCSTKGSPLSKKDDFVCPTPWGLYPHKGYCECYYSCINNRATLYKCGQQNLFDLNKNACNFPQHTDCGNRTRPEGYPPTSTPPSIIPFECPPDVADDWFADPSNCASFYRCVYGTAYHFTCADPNLYHEVNKECDHPGKVDCGSRPRP